jgi:uncharacterized protein (TIGR00290 family)
MDARTAPIRNKPTREKVVLSWSGGKDSSMAAYHLIASQKYEIAALMTTVTEGFERISMHGVRVELLEKQAASLDIPLRKVMIPRICPNEIYEARMKAALEGFKAQGVERVAFGDLFLEDLKRYRDERLASLGMTGVYPIWKRDTDELVRTFIALGFKGLLSCVDGKALDGSFSGRPIDHELLRDLPDTADPCGENGEFHSFVFDGPIFRRPIKCRLGERQFRDERFHYCDILPDQE